MDKRRLYEIVILVFSGLLIVSYAAFVFYTSVTMDGLLGNQKKYPPAKSYLYGIPIDSMIVVKDQVKPGQSLSDILEPHGVSMRSVDLLIKRSAGTFDLRKIKAGNHYTLICVPDSSKSAFYMV